MADTWKDGRKLNYTVEAYSKNDPTRYISKSYDTLEEAKKDADGCITIFEYEYANAYVGDEDGDLGEEPFYSVVSKVPGVIVGREHEAPPPMPAPTLGFWCAAALHTYLPYMIAGVAIALTFPVSLPMIAYYNIKDVFTKKPKYRGTVRPLHPIGDIVDHTIPYKRRIKDIQ